MVDHCAARRTNCDGTDLADAAVFAEDRRVAAVCAAVRVRGAVKASAGVTGATRRIGGTTGSLCGDATDWALDGTIMDPACSGAPALCAQADGAVMNVKIPSAAIRSRITRSTSRSRRQHVGELAKRKAGAHGAPTFPTVMTPATRRLAWDRARIETFV
jgi:hypothetical protein